MLTGLVVVLRSLALICCGHRAVALENVALRQQLAVFRRTGKRPQLRTGDRLFWVLLSKAWQGWRAALVVVHPDTVVRWHRQWLRRRWTQRSAHAGPGRPSTDAVIRKLVGQMCAANPLWGAPRIHGELIKIGIDISERTVSRLSATAPSSAIADLAHLPDESPDILGVAGLLYRADSDRARALCPRAPVPSPSAHCPCADHRASDRRVDGVGCINIVQAATVYS